MDIEVQKNNLCINQVIGEKKENITIQGDIIIPDIKPDILNAINTSGIVCIYKKEVLDKKIRIDGCISTNIIYLADNELSSIRGVDSNIDFSIDIEMEKAKQGMTIECDLIPKSMECKVLNGRKVNVKCLLEVNAKIFLNEDIEFVEDVTNIKDVQKLNMNLSINSLLGMGVSKSLAKDTLTIDEIDNLVEILKNDINIVNKETKVSYNKVLAKADMEVKILYLTEDNRVNCVKNRIPVIGFIEIQNVSENNLCDVKYDIKNVNIKPNNVEEHSINVEIEVEMECKVYENKEVGLIEDLYSPSTEICSDCKNIITMQDKKKAQDICNIRKKETIRRD